MSIHLAELLGRHLIQLLEHLLLGGLHGSFLVSALLLPLGDRDADIAGARADAAVCSLSHVQGRRLSDVKLAVRVRGGAIPGGLPSGVLTRADRLDVWAHPGTILRVLLIVLGMRPVRSSARPVGLALTRDVQTGLLQIFLHVERLPLQGTVAGGCRYYRIARSDAIGSLVLLSLLPARRWVEGPSIVLNDARDDIAVAVFLKMVVEIGLGIADVSIELGIVSVVILWWRHLFRSVGIGQLSVY